jgi:copper resistance protein D
LIVDGQALLLFAVKAVFTAAALLSIGSGLHAALGVTPAKIGRAGFQLVAAASGATVALMLVRFAMLNAQLGGSLSAAFDASFFAWTWAALGPFAVATTLGCVAGILAAAFSNRWLAGASAVLLAAGFAFTGHTAAMEQPALASIAVALHVLIAGFWIAAPLNLYPGSTVSDEDLYRRLLQFSRYASLLVPLMFALGLWLAWTLAGGLQPLFGSPYGGLLLVKLAAASIALALGAINQRFLTELFPSHPDRGRKWLKRTLLVDAALFALAVLAISAATTLTGPPSLS